MHLVSTNLVTWVQFLFAKNQSTEKSIAKYFNKKKKDLGKKILSNITTTISSIIDNSDEEDDNISSRSIPANSRSRIPYTPDCRGLECVFGSFTKIFYTAVVEYSLIAAVVMFIVWHNLGRKKSNRISHSMHQISPPFPLKKLVFGLIFGLIFTIGTALSMIFFYVNWYHNEHLDAALNFNITDTVQNGIGIIACIFAFWRLRLLDFADHGAEHDPHHDIHANQELLDMILLAIGTIGELSFSISGLAGVCSNKAWNSLTILLAIARILRIIQSIIQSFLIAFASKLKSTDPDRHPGRQTITFLITLNMAMFIYQWFISDKAGTYEGVISLYGEESWAFFVSIFSPLTVFFRFHSSVCFVEIWKHTYAKPH
uniref:Uncharacterized protein n=1 Tax=Panagrolaimus davidi TaxID=227884 RepID=A0A914PWV5_9BILA